MKHSMTLMHFLILCTAVVLTALPARAQNAQQLHRGLNLSSWLANAPRQTLFARDFSQIKQAGFDHVRLPFNPEYVGFKLAHDSNGSDGGISHIDFIALDRALAMAENYKLPVILDLHPGGEFIETLEKYPWAEDEYIALWTTIAKRYRGYSSAQLMFELLNEPQYYKAEARWSSLARRLTAAIRGPSPDRTIIVGAPHGSEIDGLPYLQTSDDPYIIYAFHFYEPYLITHQGIHMGFENKMIRYFRHLPYPSNLAVHPASDYTEKAPNPAQAQNEFLDYIRAPWNNTHITTRIDIAHNWAVQHHVRLLCGEFGVLRNHIDAASRYRWIEDTRKALDHDGIGWELWDYTDLFGIAPPAGSTSTDPIDGSVRPNDPTQASRRFEPEALTALGLGDQK